MEPIVRAILNCNVKTVKELLGDGQNCHMLRILRKNVKRVCYSLLNYKDSTVNCNYNYIANFEGQRKQLLELLDVDERNKTKSEQHQIGLDFLLFTCKFVQEGILDFLSRFRVDDPSKDKWDLIEILKDFKAGKEEIYNFLLNGGIGAVEINRLHLLHRYVNGYSVTEETVKRFLQLGADVNSLDDVKRSVLNYAVHYGSSGSRIEIIKLLLEHGTNPNLGRDCTLADAARCGSYELMELLLAHGAFINGRPGDESTPLASAARHFEVKIVELLLDRGAERDDRILHDVVGVPRFDVNRQTKLVELLLERGFDLKFATQDDTVLCRAVKSCNGEIVKLLLNYGAQVNEANVTSMMFPLHIAVANGQLSILQYLLDYGADINKECDGRTALTMSVNKTCDLQSKFIIKHVILRKSLGLFVSEANLNAARAKKNLARCCVVCEQELEKLKAEKFDDSTLFYYDILTINDTHRLASLASNENIAKAISSDNFERKFPIYSDLIIGKFERGIAKKKDFALFKRFIDYLSTRDHDRLPKLPFTFVSEIFTYLNDRDVAATLRKL